jgi:hypothetical protein
VFIGFCLIGFCLNVLVRFALKSSFWKVSPEPVVFWMFSPAHHNADYDIMPITMRYLAPRELSFLLAEDLRGKNDERRWLR